MQATTLTAVDGTTLPATSQAVTNSKVINPIVDDFQQLAFTDPTTGTTLGYNLFVPRDYDPAKRYPLVLFMHDASVVGAPPTGPLVQGLGAVSWASPEDQSERNGATVARAVWDGQSNQEQFSGGVDAVTAQHAAINYVALAKGTTLPTGSSSTAGASEHMGTWRVAYGIPGIRDGSCRSARESWRQLLRSRRCTPRSSEAPGHFGDGGPVEL